MSIYQPAEDSFLMLKILEQKLPKLINKNPNLKFLEIGAGSGIHLQTAQKLGVKNIFSCDINPEAVAHCKKLDFQSIQSDLFEKIKNKFNLIIFNPPYLPKDSREPKNSQIATTGGKKGNEIILEFLKQAKFHLKKDGKIFLITSSLAKPEINFKELGYKAKEIGCEKLFFERLNIWELEIK